jgi:hypothetical protein
MDNRTIRRAFLALLSGVLATCSAAPARAQAWLPPKGEAWLSLGYGNSFSTKHYLGLADPDGTVENDAGHTRMQTVGLQLGYGITDRLAMSVGLPFVTGKYMGTKPHIVNGAIVQDDDGGYHGTFQDYQIRLAYRLFNGGVAVSPFAAGIIPSHSYPDLSHAAPGRGLRELQLGLSGGAILDRILPGSYVQATYAYAIVERVEAVDVSLNRSDFAVEVGYYLTPSLAARALTDGYYTHGGLVFRTPANLPPELYQYHDQIGKVSAVHVGGGLSYALTGSTEVSATYRLSVYGRGGHKLDHGLSLGATWSFSPEQIVRRMLPPKSPEPVSPPR